MRITWRSPAANHVFDTLFEDDDEEKHPAARVRGAVLGFGSLPIWGPNATLQGLTVPDESAPELVRLHFLRQGGFPAVLEVDAATHLPAGLLLYPRVKRERLRRANTTRREWIRVAFGDYRSVDGLVLPHSYQFFFEGQLVETWTLDALSVEYATTDSARTDESRAKR